MTPFLKSVVKAYFENSDIQKQVFIFPNRRALMFFRKYLSEIVATGSDNPVFAPQMLTINDFFYRLNDINPTDRLSLILNLYEVYKKNNKKAETLDEFIFWGDIILGDFNDIDKYLVDSKQLFTNIEDLKNIRDDYSYLSDNQRRAIETFVSHFSDLNGRLTVDLSGDSSDVKTRFLYIWNLLYPIYLDYNELLRSKDMAYEGMVYRNLASSLKDRSIKEELKGIFPYAENYVFVGLNALNECEKTLMRKMRDEGIADFAWDYFSDLIRDKDNKSSFFLTDNLKEFPSRYEALYKEDVDTSFVPEINVVSVASSVGQAKLIPSVLDKLELKETNTAIVLPDENLLVPVLNSIPPEISDINVTMGYPIENSSFFILMQEIARLQLNIRKSGGYSSFYYKELYSILSNNIFKYYLKDEYLMVSDLIKKEGRVYIKDGDLTAVPKLKNIFKAAVDKNSANLENINNFSQYLLEVTTLLAGAIKEEPNLAFELEFAKEYYKTVLRLSTLNIEVLPHTFLRLINQLIQGQTLPFRGEPLKGLQIMGPLETRALDFENILILSTNESIFPRKSVSSSFIPPELRRAFNLPTYEYQDAVWAYYFYRLLQRTKKLWLVYDSRTEGVISGEESRYIKQLRYHFQVPINDYATSNRVKSFTNNDVIEKTQEDIDKIKNITYSASTLNSYLDCSMKFYYAKIKNLRPENKVRESLDAGMIGNVFHKTMQTLYSNLPDNQVTKAYLDGLIKNKAKIKQLVNENIFEEIKSSEIIGRNIVIQEVIFTYVIKALKIDKAKLEERGLDYFTILGLEKKMYGDFNGYKFVGFIDRLDSYEKEQLRIVDYKTGKVLPIDVLINDENAFKIAKDIFDPTKTRAKIALQFYIYNRLIKENSDFAPKLIMNSVYSTAAMFKDSPLDTDLNITFYNEMSEKIEDFFNTISDINVPFEKTTDVDKKCLWCDFKVICGR